MDYNVIPSPFNKYSIKYEFQHYLLQPFMHAQYTMQKKKKIILKKFIGIQPRIHSHTMLHKTKKSCMKNYGCYPMHHITIVPFQVQHKLYNFHFCQIFQKETTLNVENSIKKATFEPTTSSKKLEVFHQSNQKCNKRLIKVFETLL